MNSLMKKIKAASVAFIVFIGLMVSAVIIIFAPILLFIVICSVISIGIGIMWAEEDDPNQ